MKKPKYTIPITVENLILALSNYFPKYKSGNIGQLVKMQERLVEYNSINEHNKIDMNSIDKMCRRSSLVIDDLLKKKNYTKVSSANILDYTLSAYLPCYQKFHSAKISDLIVTDLKKSLTTVL